ncbi:hypothetical protein ILUMI_04632 [Ignelater luminosus]|uniref:Partial AB-hydrolase lipase domain-containing protein n=1 Tax=Ignelater luminosus TaxID=2038154 RepID=A0A8K0D9A9_IGNLU|nr:hypothetical protein ILUMI_04632 [Ignelater luminosus]
MAPNYSLVLLLLQILYNGVFVFSIQEFGSNSVEPLAVLESTPNLSETLNAIADILNDSLPEFNYNKVIMKAEEFYATLPKSILNEATMLVPELVRTHGYPCETHKMKTSDGYILTMHRIPHGQDESKGTKDRPVVYLQHGLLSSSADWLIPGPEKGIGYILADAGYDVWLPNARGNTYSRNHVSLDPDGDEFWNFSWHEIALNDVTVMIDYALSKTKQENLYYIGHSQGTTVFYVLCSEKPEYNEKIRVHISLAPIAYMSHMTSPLLQIVATGGRGLQLLADVSGVGEFMPNTGFLGKVGNVLCSEDSVTQVLCTNAMFAVCGFNQKQMNATLLPIIMGHSPAGSSIMQVMHYVQEIKSGKFRQYDYGLIGNNRHYDNTSPPRYLLHKVTAPVYLFYSRNDWVSAESDVLRLYRELGNVQERILIEDGKFNHVDYLYAIDARELVYDKVITRLKAH